MTSLDGALGAARARGLERLDAQLLLGHVLGRSRAWLIAHGDEPLDEARAAAYDALCARRAGGEPLAYLVGQREFHGLALAVGPGVLVPRPDTETLVDWALALLAGPLAGHARPAVLDLGTGSGAIALAVKDACPRADVWAIERSPTALAMARLNASRTGLEVRFAAGDWWQALAAIAGVPAFDLALANPPYIAPGDPHLPALAHEPLEALVGGEDGLADIAAIAQGAGGRLAAGAWLLLEHGNGQGPAARRLLARAGFADILTRDDLAGRPRCTGGRWTKPNR